MSESAEGQDNRRRHTRFTLNLLVQHRFQNFDEFAKDTTLDLSEGGMFFRTEHPHPVGSQVYFQLMLQNGARLVEGLGRVVRVVDPAKDQQGGLAGMALEFVNLDDHSRTVIRDAVRGAGGGG